MKYFLKANSMLFFKIILAIYTLYSLKYLFKLKHIESEFYMNVTFIFIIAAVYFLINYTLNILKNDIDKRLLIISIIMALYFAFTVIIGTYYEGATKGERYAEILNFTFNDFLVSLKYIPALWFLFLGLTLFLFIKIPKIYNNYIKQYESYTEIPKIFNNLYKIWFFIFVCWLPYFILFYPGFVFIDASWQIDQVYCGQFNTHHPVFTTLCMFFIPFYYKISNNGILTIALYVLLFQMIPLSFIYAYMIHKLNNIYNVNKMIVIFLILFVSIYPANPITSINIEKGVVFIIFFILFLMKIVELTENQKLLHNKKYIIQFILIGTVLCLTRNNVIYALFFAAFFMFIFAAKYRKSILLLFMGIFVFFLILNGVILKLTNASKGEFRESMSIPIQQIARVYKYHKDTLNDEDIKFIEKMMQKKEALNAYKPKISDDVKYYTDSNFFKTKEFIVGYTQLGLKYPGTYLNASLIMFSQFLYPFSNSFWHEGLSILTSNIASLNITSKDYLKHQNQKIKTYLSQNQFFVKKNKSMGLFVLVNQSFLFYIFLFTFIYFLYRRFYKYTFILLLPLGYTATLFLGPIIYFRYTYYLAALIPLLVMMLTNCNNTSESNNSKKMS